MTSSDSGRGDEDEYVSSPEAEAQDQARSDAEYIPTYLRSHVFHYYSDFYATMSFDPVLVAHLMYEGFLPIATEDRKRVVLLPKLHRLRNLCVLDDNASLHVPKTVKKRGKKYLLRINQDFDAVVAGCHTQHGVAWLYPPIVKCFKTLFSTRTNGVSVVSGARVRLYSIEVLDVTTNVVVAGELGYTVGRVYTSLTGFSAANGAGTVQLHALKALLLHNGIAVWDLGMSMPYKASLGADDVPRDEFLVLLYKWRMQDKLLELDMASEHGTLESGVHIKELFTLPSRSVPPGDISTTETAM